MSLEEYRRKRDFSATPEPPGDPSRPQRARPKRRDADAPLTWDELPHGRRFCVQQHRATRMHLDFRLEHDGVLLSWAIPRGPTLDPAVKRLAVQTEDHPVDYGDFEGVIPSGYGAGTVLLWDIGTFEWVRESAEDFDRSRARGDIKFRLQGTKIGGEFALIHVGARGTRDPADEKSWLLIKRRDEHVQAGYEALEHEVSVKSGRNLSQIAADEGGDPRERARARRAGPRPAGAAPPAPGPLALPPPMLATPVTEPFSRDGWLFELKWDGVRVVAGVDAASVRLTGRSGRDETSRYPEVAGALRRALRGHSAVVDGEVVVLEGDGRPSFERLQARINVTRDADVRRATSEAPVTYVVFDLLNLDGRDLTQTALRIRKKTLHDVLLPADGVVYAEHVERDGLAFFDAVRAQGIEGLVAKRADSVYQPGRRSADWLKLKSWLTQSCVVAGWTGGRGRRSQHIGALILGVRAGADLVHCGQVGTGFDDRMLSRLRQMLAELAVERCPLRVEPRTQETAHWVRPELVCEVRHAGWTRAGILRHPAFAGLRPDLVPDDCVREQPAPLSTAVDAAPRPAAVAEPEQQADRGDGRSSSRRRRGRCSAAGAAASAVADGLQQRLAALPGTGTLEVDGLPVRLTNLDKVLWPQDSLTKRDLVAHYLRVAPVLLPYLRDRPLSMQVFPDGIGGKSFWRKDKPEHAPPWVPSWTYHGEKTKDYVVVNDRATLAWVANAASIDLHPWHSRIDAPQQPDWAVFDIDPAEGATFETVVVLARLIGVALAHYGLRSALKTTGQTGLQIYVPIRRGPDYSAVRGWVEGVSRAVGNTVPDMVSWEWTVRRRTGRVRLDYTQNIINKTLTAPYTVRAVSGAPVSAPISWEELDDPDLRPDRWTVHTIGERITERGDLFHAVLDGDQDLPALD